MPIGTSKVGALGGLVPGGSVTFNTSGNWSVPPGVKKVSITGKGSPGNPGNPGNAGNPGRLGTGGGGAGGSGNWPFIPTPQFRYEPWQGGGAWKTGPGCNTQITSIPACICARNQGWPAAFAPGGGHQGAGSSGASGASGQAGQAGQAGNSGQVSSGLGNNFPGGSGGNAGAAGNAGTGGSGGPGGSVGQIGLTNAQRAPGVAGGAGGTGGGAGGSIINGRCPATPIPVLYCGYACTGGGGGGAGATNDGQNGNNQLYTNNLCNSRINPAIGGTTSGFSWPFQSIFFRGQPGACTTGGLGGKAGILTPGQRNQPSPNPNTASNSQGLNSFITYPVQLRPMGRTPSPQPTPPAYPGGQVPNNSNAFRSGGGGGSGASNTGPQNTPVPQLAPIAGTGGGGGGRGNVGNAGGSGGAGGTGAAANPTTFNCVTVTPGATVPITVAAPGGEIVISWNPQ